MKTSLDEHPELYFERLCEDATLICWVVPLKTVKRRIVPNYEVRYSVEFKDVEAYIVLREVLDAAFDNKYVDEKHLTECTDSRLSKVLQIEEILGDNIKHFALRTAHCVIHVFTSKVPEISEVQAQS